MSFRKWVNLQEASSESGYQEEQCKPGGCRLWRCLQMKPPEDLQEAEGIPWISVAAKAQSHLHIPLPTPGCVQHSTVPSHSLVSQFSLGKSNPREGKNQRVFIFLSLFWTWGRTIRNALSKTPSKFLHIPNLCIKFNQNPLYAPHQSAHTKQSLFLIFMNLQKGDLCKEHFWWFRQWLCLTAQRIVWCLWKAPSHIHSSAHCGWISRADCPHLGVFEKILRKTQNKGKNINIISQTSIFTGRRYTLWIKNGLPEASVQGTQVSQRYVLQGMVASSIHAFHKFILRIYTQEKW